MSAVYDILNQNGQQQPVQNYNTQSIPANPFMSQLQKFAGAINGNPEQIVRGLMQSGRMSQEQFNMLSQQASQIAQMLHLR